MSRFRAIVLCYHAVSDTWPDPLAVAPKLFERQLRGLLRRHLRPVTASEALAGTRGVLHVTFDDAYTSVRNALPILERLRVPATVFACTAYADDGRPLDFPELAGQAALYPQELATMTWDALRDLADRGVEIGSHTATHPHLTRLSDGELDAELHSSRARLEDELRRPCRYVAYPFGEDDPRVHAAARRAGFAAGFSLGAAVSPVDRFAIPRADLYPNDGVLRTALKTSIAAPALRTLAHAVRRRGLRFGAAEGDRG